MKRAVILGLAVLGASASHAVSSFTLNSGGTVPFYFQQFLWDGSFSASGQTGTFNPGSSSSVTGDGIYQNFFAVKRTIDSTFQAVKFNSVTVAASGPSVTMEYYNNTTFSLFVKYTLFGVSNQVGTTANNAKGYLQMDWTLTNKSGATSSYNLAHYAELDPKAPTTSYASSTLPTMVGNGFAYKAGNGDVNASTLYHWGSSVDAYESAIYTTLRPRLVGTSSVGSGTVGSLVNTTASTAGDISTALQTNIVSLANGASAKGVFVLGYNAVPEPGTWAALGLGVAATLRRRRK